MTSLVVDGKRATLPQDLRARTYEDGAPRFAAARTRRTATALVLHETCTRSVESTVAVLKRRRLSVHLIVGPDGELTQHGDLARDVLWHAGPVHNETSFGVEVVNPYYPRLLRRGLPWSATLDAPWAHEGRYVLPTPAQAEAVAGLVGWATASEVAGLSIPRRWPGLRAGLFQLGPLAEAARPLPGVLAHHYFGHADGAWLALYTWLRLAVCLDPVEAFAQAVRRAAGVRHAANVRDLVPSATRNTQGGTS